LVRAGQGIPRVLPSVQIAGKEYFVLTDWAESQNLQMRWIKHDETLQLTNRAAKIVLATDSREAHFNGVAVWLSFPVVYRNGTIYLSQLDAQKTFQPLLSAPKNRRGDLIKTICLDPGHGGRDSGNRVGMNQEKIYTLLLAEELRLQLKQVGFRVTMTRTTDDFVELPDRPELAKRRGADLFVSLHFNSSQTGRDSVRGAEVYCLTPAGAESTNAGGEGGPGGTFAGNSFNQKNVFLAYKMQQSLLRCLDVEDRGIRRARFWVLRDALMPAVLIEAGFMSHPQEGKKIFTGAYRRQLAHAILQGILAYKRAVEPGSGS
jgi:N-acetylmuramoyl-L-alanine amidase